MSIPNGSPQPQQPAPQQYPQGAPNPYMQNAPQPTAPALSVPLDQPYYGCPFVEAFTRFWKKYATFKGRASRSEFWWFMLADVIISFALGAIANTVDQLSFLPTLWALATFIPMMALATRRLHDANKSGWWLFGYYAISGVTIVVFIATIVMSIVALLKNGSNCLVGSYGTAFGATNGMTPEMLTRCLASDEIVGFGIVMAIVIVISIALSITYIVFMAMKSKPEGARFDDQAAQAQAVPPLYGAPAYGAPAYGTPTYGEPVYGGQNYGAPAYGQPGNQAPIYPAANAPTAPMAPMTNGTMNVSAYQQAPTAATATQPMYAAPEAPAYQVPPIPDMPPMAMSPEGVYGAAQPVQPIQNAQPAQPVQAVQAEQPAAPEQAPLNADADPAAAQQIPFDAPQQSGEPSETAGTADSNTDNSALQ